MPEGTSQHNAHASYMQKMPKSSVRTGGYLPSYLVSEAPLPESKPERRAYDNEHLIAQYADLLTQNKRLEAELMKLSALNTQLNGSLVCDSSERRERMDEMHKQVVALVQQNKQLNATMFALKDEVDAVLTGQRSSLTPEQRHAQTLNAIALIEQKLREKDSTIRHLSERIANNSRVMRPSYSTRQIVYHHTNHKDARRELLLHDKNNKINALMAEVGSLRENNSRLRADVDGLRGVTALDGKLSASNYNEETVSYVHDRTRMTVPYGATMLSPVAPIYVHKVTQLSERPGTSVSYRSSRYGNVETISFGNTGKQRLVMGSDEYDNKACVMMHDGGYSTMESRQYASPAVVQRQSYVQGDNVLSRKVTVRHSLQVLPAGGKLFCDESVRNGEIEDVQVVEDYFAGY